MSVAGIFILYRKYLHWLMQILTFGSYFITFLPFLIMMPLLFFPTS